MLSQAGTADGSIALAGFRHNPRCSLCTSY